MQGTSLDTWQPDQRIHLVPKEVQMELPTNPFVLNSTKGEIYPDYKCPNANNCLHSNIYLYEKYYNI